MKLRFSSFKFGSVLLVIVTTLLCAHPLAAQGLKPKTPPILQQRLGVYNPAQYDSDRLSYDAAMNAKDYDRARLIRDGVIYHVLANIDFGYGSWKADLFAGTAKKKTIFDIGENALVAAIGLTNVLSTKDAFTAVLQFVRGTRASYNANFFNSMSLTVIIAAADAARLTKGTEIEDKLAAQTARNYPLDEALADTIQYYTEGSIASGLQRLSEQAGANLQAARTSATNARAARAAQKQQQ